MPKVKAPKVDPRNRKGRRIEALKAKKEGILTKKAKANYESSRKREALMDKMKKRHEEAQARKAKKKLNPKVVTKKQLTAIKKKVKIFEQKTARRAKKLEKSKK